MDVQIRDAGLDDIAPLAQVHLATVTTAYASLFPPWAPPPTSESLVEDWLSTLSDQTCKAFIAEDERRAVGTVAVRREPASEYAQLRRLHVLPEKWNVGIGSALHDVAIDAMRSAGYEEAALWILGNNDRARSFYEHRGWTLVAGRKLRWPQLGAVEVRYHLRLK